MEEYKRSLCHDFSNITSEEEIYSKIKDNPGCTCNLNEDGLLHSAYNETHYEPAVTFREKNRITYYWLFNGEIKDCEHPFMIHTYKGRIMNVTYYSLERIQTNRPIYIYCGNYQTRYEKYNMYFNSFRGEEIQILDDYKYKYGREYDDSIYCNINTTPECYPLWDEMEPRFKFAD